MLELMVTQMGAAGDGIAPLPEGGSAFISFRHLTSWIFCFGIY